MSILPLEGRNKNGGEMTKGAFYKWKGGDFRLKMGNLNIFY